MPLQIFVEDQLSNAYEILALRALGLTARDRRRDGSRSGCEHPFPE